MSTILDKEFTISGEYYLNTVDTSVSIGLNLSDQTNELKNKEAWTRIIDYTLVGWGLDPHHLEDDGLEPPNIDIIAFTINLAKALRDGGTSAPLRVVPNGEGGIVFEKRSGPFFVSLEINADESIEYIEFENSKIVERVKFHLPA